MPRRRLWAVPVLVLVALVAVLVTGLGQPSRRARPRYPQSAWAPPLSQPLSDAQAAALVTPRPEQRTGNVSADDYVPSDAQLLAFYSARNRAGETTVRWNPLFRFVTGRPGLFHPSTDDLIQWVAHKWGIPEDWIRAQMTLESDWRMSELGDRRTVSASWYARYPPQAQIAGTSSVYESMGIAQVKWIPDDSVGAGTEPLRWQSTAFSLDVYAATVRYYYNGDCHWCRSDYGPGQKWNSVGAWYSPTPWRNLRATLYVHMLQRILKQKPWE